MKTAHDIILKPVITENSMAGIADKKYTFKVATDATKVDSSNIRITSSRHSVYYIFIRNFDIDCIVN